MIHFGFSEIDKSLPGHPLKSSPDIYIKVYGTRSNGASFLQNCQSLHCLQFFEVRPQKLQRRSCLWKFWQFKTNQQRNVINFWRLLACRKFCECLTWIVKRKEYSGYKFFWRLSNRYVGILAKQYMNIIKEQREGPSYVGSNSDNRSKMLRTISDKYKNTQNFSTGGGKVLIFLENVSKYINKIPINMCFENVV